jgi:hypothetical protein
MRKLLLLEKIVAWLIVAMLIVGFVMATAMVFFGAYFTFELIMSVKNQ